MNYVIIYPDEMRAESLACYGHPTVKTPNIDQLAKEGTLFENNYIIRVSTVILGKVCDYAVEFCSRQR